MQAEPQPKKSKAARNVFIGLFGFLVLFYGTCAVLLNSWGNWQKQHQQASYTPPKPILPPDWKPNGGLTHNYDAQWKVSEYGSVRIVGTVKNESAKAFRYAQISFNILDKAGNQVGNAFSNVTGLEAGRT